MGMVLFPVFIGALIIFIRSIFTLVTLIKGDELLNQTLIIGAIIPIIVLIITVAYWIYKGNIYAFQPYFTLLFRLIYFPMMVRILTKNILSIQSLDNFNSMLTVWIITAGILMIPIFMYIGDFLKGNGVKLHY